MEGNKITGGEEWGENPSSVTVYLLQVSICRSEAFGIGHDSGVNVEFFSSWRGGKGRGGGMFVCIRTRIRSSKETTLSSFSLRKIEDSITHNLS